MSTTCGLRAAGELDGLGAVARLAGDLHVGLGLDDHPHAAAHERLVVGDEDADHARCSSPTGSRAATRKPPSGARLGLERAAVERRALAHADQAVAGVAVAARGRAGAVVGDLERDVALAEVDGDVRRGARAGVLADVGQRLLHDAVGGEVDAGRERALPAADLDVDRDVGGAALGHELVQPREARLRRRGRVLLVGAQDAEQPAHLADRLPAGGLDGQQRLADALRGRRRAPAGRRRPGGP